MATSKNEILRVLMVLAENAEERAYEYGHGTDFTNPNPVKAAEQDGKAAAYRWVWSFLAVSLDAD